jgi:hypothetical protein
MARGSQAKTEITEKILKMFDGAFVSGKEIRVPVDENGDLVQIKITLTAAKVNVDPPAEGAIPNAASEQASPQEKVEVTEEEKNNIQKLMSDLNL